MKGEEELGGTGGKGLYVLHLQNPWGECSIEPESRGQGLWWQGTGKSGQMYEGGKQPKSG